MNGTGTQTDPYIITTVDELYEMDTVGGKNVYFKLGADLDFNGTDYALNYKAIPLKFAEFDGDGHSISNIFVEKSSGISVVCTMYTTSYAAEEQVMKNVNFKNVIVSGPELRFFRGTSLSGKLIIRNCTISCTFRSGANLSNGNSARAALMAYGSRYLHFELCTLAIKAELMNAHPLMSNGSFSRGQINLDMTYLHGNDYSTERDSLFFYQTLTDSYIFGKIRQTGEAIEGENNYYFSAHDDHKGVYQVVEYENISNVYWNSSLTGPCFYDKDVAGAVTILNEYESNKNPEWLYALTTEQCKDVEYLKSIGYLVEEGV